VRHRWSSCLPLCAHRAPLALFLYAGKAPSADCSTATVPCVFAGAASRVDEERRKRAVMVVESWGRDELDFVHD
jgi:hypothetical protein